MSVWVSKSKKHICEKDYIWNPATCSCESGKYLLKSDSHLPKIFLFIYFSGSPLKMMKNAVYFISKALFVLKIFRSLSWHSGHVEETV